jgi:predicted secreted protein
MPIGSIIAIFFVVWWIVLFAVLPWGVRTQEEEGEVVLGTSASAPAHPHLVRKAIITTIVAAIVTFLIWMLFGHLGIGVKEIADWLEGRGP